MSEKTQLTIGELLTTENQRDAIHVAVVPVITSEIMKPGDKASLVPGSPVMVKPAKDSPVVGVIDPFIDGYIPADSKVWLFLCPRTVTGMRHEWAHPAFDGQTQPAPAPEVTKADAKQWLQDFASRWCFNWGDMLSAATGGIGDFVVAQGHDLHGAGDLGEDEALFWQYLEIYTGKTFSPEHKQQFGWSCSC